jgi:Histidine kinase-, DNA gyrase B-, and HSP90-like ATPase
LEGPYRDLGLGFARLTGAEGLRRSPGRIRSIEDALLELLRNSRDAGARNVYVASSLRARRYRTLVVIDDGRGIPETHRGLIFEPGVTTRHLDPISYPDRKDALHGAGLSLYHLKYAALSAEVLSASSPTTIKAVFDTHTLPEKSLQSGTRPSRSNLSATLTKFIEATSPQTPRLYYASPARILARLLKNRIIRGSGVEQAWKTARALGLEISLRTVRRVISGEILAVDEATGGRAGQAGGNVMRRNGLGGPILSVGAEDLAEISAILQRAARGVPAR